MLAIITNNYRKVVTDYRPCHIPPSPKRDETSARGSGATRKASKQRADGSSLAARAANMADVKALTPFLQRADEMSRADPKVAYYCRMYAVEEGMRATERSSEFSKLLGELLAQLEATKAAAQLAETREEDELYLENFALKLFAKADKADRAGARDARTAKLFYVSSVFIEILNQFGPVEQDVGEKQRYAAWRGAELSGCARDGRVPPPPPDDTRGGGGGGGANETESEGANGTESQREETTDGDGDGDETDKGEPSAPAWLPPAPHHPVSPPSAPPMSPPTARAPSRTRRRPSPRARERRPRPTSRRQTTTRMTSRWRAWRTRRCTPSSRCPRWRTRTSTPPWIT